MDDIVDSSIRFYDNRNRANNIETTKEFILRMFLKNRYPDVLVTTAAWNHIKFKDSIEQFTSDIEYYRRLLRMYLPPTTKVYWVTGFRESEKSRPAKATRYINMTRDGMLASERIDLLNHVLFQKIRDEIQNASSGVYGFLDLIEVSKDVTGWLRGVHMAGPTWYTTIAAYLLELICGKQ